MKRIIDGKKTNITGKRIKAARIKAGLSQQQLSDKLELSAVYVCRGSVSRIENGERAVNRCHFKSAGSNPQLPFWKKRRIKDVPKLRTSFSLYNYKFLSLTPLSRNFSESYFKNCHATGLIFVKIKFSSRAVFHNFYKRFFFLFMAFKLSCTAETYNAFIGT